MPLTKRKIMSDTKPVYEIRNNSGSAFLNPSKTEDWHQRLPQVARSTWNSNLARKCKTHQLPSQSCRMSQTSDRNIGQVCYLNEF